MPAQNPNSGGRSSRVLLFLVVLLVASLGGYYYSYHAETLSLLGQLQALEDGAVPAEAPGNEAATDSRDGLVRALHQRKLNANEQTMLRSLAEKARAHTGGAKTPASK